MWETLCSALEAIALPAFGTDPSPLGCLKNKLDRRQKSLKSQKMFCLIVSLT